MLKSFKGGIRPPLLKELTEHSRLENISIPQISYIQLQQHIGTPAAPAVKKGDTVSEGQIIGLSSGNWSSNVHASVPGRVVEITEYPSVFKSSTTIVIEAEGAFAKTGSRHIFPDWSSLTREELIRKAHHCGIAGMGGESFPSDLTEELPVDRKVDVIIVDATLCEPYLTADDIVIKTYPDELLEGIQIALKITGAEKAVIGIEHYRKNTAGLLEEAVAKSGLIKQISVKKIINRYPAGAEKQLVYYITGRIICGKDKPVDVGVPVHSIATIYALREAILLDKPVIEKYITVSGKMINKPGNYKVRIGTRISDIVEECGGLSGKPARVIAGGPMSGLTVSSMDVPVVKSITALLFLGKDEIRSENYEVCIRCGRCVRVCPMGLVPCKIAAAEEKGNPSESLHAELCIMCGSCSFICPSNRLLTDYIRNYNEKYSRVD